MEKECCLNCSHYSPFGKTHTYHECWQGKKMKLIKKNVKTCRCGAYEKVRKM